MFGISIRYLLQKHLEHLPRRDHMADVTENDKQMAIE